MVVIEPLKVRIENFEELGFSADNPQIETAQFPKNVESSGGTFKIYFSETFYIEASDYREVVKVKRTFRYFHF